MKKIFIFCLSAMVLLVIGVKSTFALAPSLNFTVSSPAAQKVDYVLPYPGILPDHPLYALKMVRDRIMDWLIKDPVKKTEFLILMADKRIGAAKALFDGNKPELGLTTALKAVAYQERAIDSFAKAQQAGGNTNGLKDKLKNSTKKQIEILEEIITKAPATTKQGLQYALDKSNKNLSSIN